MTTCCWCGAGPFTYKKLLIHIRAEHSHRCPVPGCRYRGGRMVVHAYNLMQGYGWFSEQHGYLWAFLTRKGGKPVRIRAGVEEWRSRYARTLEPVTLSSASHGAGSSALPSGT